MATCSHTPVTPVETLRINSDCYIVELNRFIRMQKNKDACLKLIDDWGAGSSHDPVVTQTQRMPALTTAM